MSTMRLIDPTGASRLGPRLSLRLNGLLRSCVNTSHLAWGARMRRNRRRVVACWGLSAVSRRTGNSAGVELNIVKGPGHGTVLMFFYIPGIGPIDWLPQLLTASNQRPPAHHARERPRLFDATGTTRDILASTRGHGSPA